MASDNETATQFCEVVGHHDLILCNDGVSCVVCDFTLEIEEFWAIVFAMKNPTNLVH